MSNDYTFENTIPIAPLKIAALESCTDQSSPAWNSVDMMQTPICWI